VGLADPAGGSPGRGGWLAGRPQTVQPELAPYVRPKHG